MSSLNQMDQVIILIAEVLSNRQRSLLSTKRLGTLVMDTRTPEQRRRIMQAVQSKNTKPELVVRRLLHGMGYGYRLHRKDLPGRPDIVLISRRKAIFVHGCFWHGHDCRKGKLPKSRLEYWKSKLERNKERDKEKSETLEALGWSVLVIWQCEMVDLDILSTRLRSFVEGVDSRLGGTIDNCHSAKRRCKNRELIP